MNLTWEQIFDGAADRPTDWAQSGGLAGELSECSSGRGAQPVIDLHERLSEFSYGYGVTREVEGLLGSIGVQTTPFMPSLLQEKIVGFDVGFGGRGVPLLLQFKLGQSLKRFVRTDKSKPTHYISRPFYRFSIDTTEPDGQFETLIKAELDGAEVYYVAPKFNDWSQYIQLFSDNKILENSVLVSHGKIRSGIDSETLPDGMHRVVYDQRRVYICSAPVRLEIVTPTTLAEIIRRRCLSESTTLSDAVNRLYLGLAERAQVRRYPQAAPAHDESIQSDQSFRQLRIYTAFEDRIRPRLSSAERGQLFERIHARSRTRDDAIAAALGLELWGLGIQLVLATSAEAHRS